MRVAATVTDEYRCFNGGNDLGEIAQGLPCEWTEGSEIAWREYALSIVVRRTGVDLDSARGRAEAVIALGGLAEIGRLFWARVNGVVDSEREFLLDDLVGDWPKIGALWIGYLARDLDVREDAGWEEPHDELSQALECLTSRARRRCADALLEELGPNLVFATLWATRHDGVTYPFPSPAPPLAAVSPDLGQLSLLPDADEAEDEQREDDVDEDEFDGEWLDDALSADSLADKGPAYEWVRAGMFC